MRSALPIASRRTKHELTMFLTICGIVAFSILLGIDLLTAPTNTQSQS